MFLSYWRSLAQRQADAAAQRRLSRRKPIRLTLEALEERTTPTVFTVNSLADTVAVNLSTGTDQFGQVSLRSAIMAVDNGGGGDTIILPAGPYKLTLAGDANNSSAGSLDSWRT